MRRGAILLGLLGLAACTQESGIQPTPTADQVLAAQYRAGGERGAISGTETQAVMDAYRRDIAKPAASMAGSSSNINGGETGSR